MMKTKEYLAYLVTEIHTTVLATVDDEGLPFTAAIDMMDYDESSLYFLTAKGKSLYDRLVKREFVALTGMKGEDTLSTVAISIRGKVRELGPEMIPMLFEKNPYMKEIYPTPESMAAVTAFQIYEGEGEWFELSKKRIERATFTFGGAERREESYLITDACTGCGSCMNVCPRQCIKTADLPYVIEQEHCILCGNCMTVCPANAVVKVS